ncbi:MAG: GTP-binding protein [Candidatus Methanomethylophilaceae archaeon]|jgi:G3E family GTPase|nr:GTP-binding protein [Candidatus Methanomethylophilaceae archaeon]MDD3987069.1 GTP-binding protein [Candidatus Methanomethylophilaceae archaeon]MDY0252305.1 GTP-binding protein [Candidatus Methanomethylophilaceae archaeon]NCA74537.1 GTPase [Gammaproteobacteria bacterium]
MYVYILGGFLGSGKTSLLMRLASMYIERKLRVALLVNESGEVGVDGATLKAEGYDAIELPNGCICCSLSGTLQNALRNIKSDIDPDIIIIEPTGLALPHKVKELVRISMIDPDGCFIIGIVDVQRFDDLIKKKGEFFKRQMHGSDFILVNKSDLANPQRLDEIKSWMSSEFPEKPLLSISVKTGENLDKVYEMMK